MADDWDGPSPPEIQRYFDGEIDPEECRRHADRFSAEAMCRGYTEVYEHLVQDRSKRR